MSEVLYRINLEGELVPLTAEETAERRAEEAAPRVLPVPVEISDRQFAHGLWKRGQISFDEAMAFVQVGTIPPALALIVSGLPDAIRSDVELMLAGATEFLRAHPAVAAIAAAFGWNDADTDEFWRFAATL